VIDGESEDGDCGEVTCSGWGESGREWTEWSWRNDEGSERSLYSMRSL